MDTWFVIIVSICFAALIRSLLFRRRDGKKLPPGPSFLASNLLMLTSYGQTFKPFIRNMKSKYGPFITFFVGSRPYILVGSQELAHEILIQKGSVFSDRPRDTFALPSISTVSYGPTWRVLRRNLTSEMLNPSHVKSYSWARRWALHILIGRLQQQDAAGFKVDDHFLHAFFCLIIVMCFGLKLKEHHIDEIVSIIQRVVLLSQPGNWGFTLLNMFPRLGKILLRSRWKEHVRMRNDQEQVLLPLIKSRIEAAKVEENKILTYVDTLVNLQLPEEETNNGNGGKLTQKKMVSICSEFVNGGTDTTVTALQWIMANLVKYPHIQSKLYDEIIAEVGPPPPPPPQGVVQEYVIMEEDLRKMPYLKAVILEGLRRHSPTPFVLPHRVKEEVELQGFTIPRGATINFMAAEMGLDPKVWDDPMEFKPERFLVKETGSGVFDFDLNGRKGIKMMPFGVGRRMCPAADLAILHLEYFVANLIWYFHWTAPIGYHVDFSEAHGLSTFMKNPLQVKISSRTDKTTVKDIS
ncbi:hypothetical protein L1887_33702 [Cichorium endivia]|nr:hypothetical protein L1887_33702 [Cichorium endivia]